jgi:N-acetylglutamate synthase-like GNAT family acetyltransferase
MEMRVVPYSPEYRNDFIEMNQAWITEMFVMEDEDIQELENIESTIEKGGNIFFALDDNNHVMACCMIGPREDGDWEIMKFAAKGMYTGTGAGSACLEACIDYAKEKQIKKVILVSNRKCLQALHLYKKYGFTEIPVDPQKFPYERADIAFEKLLNKEK